MSLSPKQFAGRRSTIDRIVKNRQTRPKKAAAITDKLNGLDHAQYVAIRRSLPDDLNELVDLEIRRRLTERRAFLGTTLDQRDPPQWAKYREQTDPMRARSQALQEQLKAARRELHARLKTPANAADCDAIDGMLYEAEDQLAKLEHVATDIALAAHEIQSLASRERELWGKAAEHGGDSTLTLVLAHLREITDEDPRGQRQVIGWMRKAVKLYNARAAEHHLTIGGAPVTRMNFDGKTFKVRIGKRSILWTWDHVRREIQSGH